MEPTDYLKLDSTRVSYGGYSRWIWCDWEWRGPVPGIESGACVKGSSNYAFGPPRLATTARTIMSPWKRPFSMKMRLVSRPETTEPAR